MTDYRPDMLSQFWAPLCAVGASGPSGPNAQICVSVFGASIVPERPRLLVVLSKTNHTHDLVLEGGRVAITLLSEDQMDLLAALGLHSGRDGDKLSGLAYELDADGCPWFPGAAGRARCEVLQSHDLGDSTAFLVAVKARETFNAEPLRWADARAIVGDDFLARWAEKSALEQAAARKVMVWE